MKTALHATRVAFVAFIVPFMFVYRPALLTLGTPFDIAKDVLAAMLGIALTSMALEGYALRKLMLWERALCLAAGIGLIFPSSTGDLIGLALFVVLLALQWNKRARGTPPLATSPTKPQ